MARRFPLLPFAIASVALGFVCYGVWLQGQGPGPAANPQVAASAGDPAANPAANAGSPEPAPQATASGGTGTWNTPAPTSSTLGTGPCADCDIVVVTMCSVRRDHIGVYGDGPSLTPQLDSLVAGAFRMDNAWSASNFTLASLTAVLTGRFGSTTGVTSWDKGLTKNVPTLPEVLGLYGYRTGAFTIDAPSGFRPDYGLDRGFQHMEIIAPPRDTPDGRRGPGEIGPGGASARPAADWIAAQDDKPIFVMFHTRTAHYPFVVENDPTDPTGVSQLLWDADRQKKGQAMPGTAGGTNQRGVVNFGRDPVQEGVRKAGDAGVAMWRQRYNEAIGRMDLDFGVLKAALEKRGRLDKTVLIVMSDHGESLDDHGELLHGDAYYDGVVHIPMMVRVPGLPGHPVPALTSQVDVLPTVLGLVGAVVPAGVDGASMLPVLRGEAAEVRAATLVEGGVSWHDDGKARGAFVSPPWALIKQDGGCDGGGVAPGGKGPATCLYNLTTDPEQVHNAATAEAAVVAELEGRWERFRASTGQAVQLALDPAYVEELRRTGYDFRSTAP